ncbi:MAG: thioesterase family protein [Desulfobacteraceae bacterium]|nr:thioesterase family protein [Desulfobacteraceae bacterium]MBC2752919.1 thioesterase family protein [Desulfobacteraceae bacterium]
MVPTEEKAEWLERIRDIFDNKIPFNKVLGLKVHSLDMERPKIRFAMHDALVGNYIRGSLHGGVISAVIDVTGGLSAFMGLQKKLAGEPLDIKLEKFRKLGTIDLRIDYLRPGVGKMFEATGYVLRTGHKVAVTRIELKNETEQLIAVGTGAYVIA